jgi:L-asparagine transporter-like permease
MKTVLATMGIVLFIVVLIVMGWQFIKDVALILGVGAVITLIGMAAIKKKKEEQGIR